LTDTNDYFDEDNYTALARLTQARAEDINLITTALTAGFDLLPSKARLYEGRTTYCGDDTGAVNAAVVTAPYTIALTDGCRLRFRPVATNTGAATLNASALGALAVVTFAGAALTGGELLLSAFVDVAYNSTGNHWRIVNPLIDVGTITTFDIDGLAAQTSPSEADTVAIYDVGLSAKRKVTLANVLALNQTAEQGDLVLRSQLYAGA